MTTCPCTPQKDFSECCGPFLLGAATPPTAEALMRSRYSAYVRGDFSYLIDTWHSSERESAPDFGALTGIRWTGLEVLDTESGGPSDREGTVEFVVRYQRSGTNHVLHEKSRFIREDGRWYYVDGEVIRPRPAHAAKVGPNNPCPCGSGRKYKKCCLLNERRQSGGGP